MRRAVAPLVLIWIGLHAAALMLLLMAKVLGAKLVVLAALVMGTFWFLSRRPARLAPARRRAGR